MKVYLKNSFLLVALTGLLLSCEDVIQLDTRPGVEQLVIDAFLTNDPTDQVIRLTISQPYFDNSPPPPALGARVIVFSQDSTAYEFIDEQKDGNYIYHNKNGVSFLKNVGQQYALYVSYDGEEYVSVSQLRPAPAIDSIAYEAFSLPVPVDTLPKSGFIAQFYANDLPGTGDTYWIRYRRNGKLVNDPATIAISYDGGFTPNGADTDGLLFILPIRQSINDFAKGLHQDGDSLEVELHSITNEAFYYLLQVRQESANGGIFAVPSANIPTNIVNFNAASTKKALGLFSISSVQRRKSVVDKNKAKPQR